VRWHRKKLSNEFFSRKSSLRRELPHKKDPLWVFFAYDIVWGLGGLDGITPF
jgi:hypothetical protein